MGGTLVEAQPARSEARRSQVKNLALVPHRL